RTTIARTKQSMMSNVSSSANIWFPCVQFRGKPLRIARGSLPGNPALGRGAPVAVPGCAHRRVALGAEPVAGRGVEVLGHVAGQAVSALSQVAGTVVAQCVAHWSRTHQGLHRQSTQPVVAVGGCARQPVAAGGVDPVPWSPHHLGWRVSLWPNVPIPWSSAIS